MVFSVGYPKTGNMSLAAALGHLGYSVGRHVRAFRRATWEGRRWEGKQTAIVNTVEWCFPVVDRLYPKSRFILTVRDMDSLLESTRRFMRRRPVAPFGSGSGETRIEIGRMIYSELWGGFLFDPAMVRSKVEAHRQAVLRYFEKRSDLLVLPMEHPEKWRLLCEFLEHPIPSIPYPHKNRTAAGA